MTMSVCQAQASFNHSRIYYLSFPIFIELCVGTDCNKIYGTVKAFLKFYIHLDQGYWRQVVLSTENEVEPY